MDRKNNIIPFNPERKRSTSLKNKKRLSQNNNQANEKMTFWDRVGIFISEIFETILLPFALLTVFVMWIGSLVKRLFNWIGKLNS